MNRLADQRPLRRGAHASADDGMCAMEMVAWLAGEAHTDEPLCACPVIAAFVRAVNDALPDDAARDRHLRPLVPLLVGTRGSAADERHRGYLVADALVRRFAPHLLARRGWRDEAAALRALPAVRSAADARVALRALDAFCGELHAARWVLQRAIEGHPPARWVAGAVQVLRRAGDAAAWQLAADTAALLAAANVAAPVETP